MLLRSAREYVIYSRHQHAQAEADEQTDHKHLITKLGMFAQKLKIEDSQPDEEYAAGQVTPDVDLQGFKVMRNSVKSSLYGTVR